MLWSRSSRTFACIARAQDVRPKDVREIGKGGSSAIPRLTELLKDPNKDVRLEAVKQLTDARALDALLLATHDNETEVQIRATDGLVNFYLPGYVQAGIWQADQTCRRPALRGALRTRMIR